MDPLWPCVEKAEGDDLWQPYQLQPCVRSGQRGGAAFPRGRRGKAGKAYLTPHPSHAAGRGGNRSVFSPVGDMTAAEPALLWLDDSDTPPLASPLFPDTITPE